MPLSLADYLDYVRSQTVPGFKPPASVAGDRSFTRSTLTTEPGGDSSTGAGSLAGRGDTSLGGRLALNADMNVNAVSAARAAMSLVGLLSGPIGSIGSKAAVAGINAHNRGEINAALGKAGLKVGEAPPEIVADAINEAINAHNPLGLGMGLPGFPGHPAFGHQGFNAPSQTPNPEGNLNIFGTPRSDAPPPDQSPPPAPVAPPSDAPPSGPPGDPGDPGSGGGPAGPWHQGGMIPDVQRRPNLEEKITAQQGEYVLQRAAVKKYGSKLLDAINRGQAKVTLR